MKRPVLILLSVNFVRQNKNIALSIPVGGCGVGGEGWTMDRRLLIKTSFVVLWVIKQTVDGKQIFGETHCLQFGIIIKVHHIVALVTAM